jgi:dipeptidyl-peptidase III
MRLLCCLFTLILLFSCANRVTKKTDSTTTKTETTPTEKDFVWNTENFADVRMIRYQIPGFEKLTLKQKELVYYLTQAGLAGRDMMWDMNYRHNLHIRRGIENILKNYKGDKSEANYQAFLLYAKRVFFSNGIHHHYGNDKFIPGFDKDWFFQVMKATGTNINQEAFRAIFDPTFDAKKINFDPSTDLVKGSAVNFYDPDITEAEVDAFYQKIMANKDKDRPLSYGLNSKVVRMADGSLAEKVYSAQGMYADAIRQINMWLEKAMTVAENEPQRKALQLLIQYYKTGDLKTWDDYNIAWVQATEGDIDYINSFIEVYQDPKGYKGSYESIVQIKDFDASARMAVVAENAQWFEDNSPIMDAHKKKDVVGISYKVVVVAGGAGDASPSSAIGVNLPNAEWIRAEYGSKSVSLGNIIEAYANADGPGLLAEFSHDEEEIRLAKAHGPLAGRMHTALHEVIGHASGQLEAGVNTPKETLKSYASPLEEARADLVGLVYIMNPKLVELGLLESLDVAKAQYDSYIKNALMLQLRRIEPGKNIEQAHMRNRQTVANWAYQKGMKDKVIEKVVRNGKTYFNINDYNKLQALFSELLREVQRIKSQGDYEAGKNLIETYGVIVDKEIHAEVLKRSEGLNIPPYGGFINPRLVPVMDAAGKIVDVKVEYPDDFIGQMLEYGGRYSFLPDYN